MSPIIWMASYLQLCNYKIAVFNVITTNVIIMIRFSRFCYIKSAIFHFKLKYNCWSEQTLFWMYILRWKSALFISCVKECNARKTHFLHYFNSNNIIYNYINYNYIIWSVNNLLLKLLAYVCLFVCWILNIFLCTICKDF